MSAGEIIAIVLIVLFVAGNLAYFIWKRTHKKKKGTCGSSCGCSCPGCPYVSFKKKEK